VEGRRRNIRESSITIGHRWSGHRNLEEDRTVRKTITILALAALWVAACGSSTPSASSPPPAATAAASGGGASAQPSTAAASLAPTTLRVLVHQNPPFTDYMKAFNAKFEANHPGVKVEMSIVAPNDLATITQTRIAAKDVDVVDMFAFDTGVQSYMKGVTPPIWQTLADAGSLMDLTGQPFVGLYDPAATRDAGTYKDKVYEINLGRVGFSGLYLNQKLFTANNVKVPTTWSELVAACQTFKTANVPCITAGGQDGWPVFVTGYGILGSAYPDQAALVEGLWTGTIKYNDATSLAMWEKLRILAKDMIEPGATGIAADGAPGRFASGEVAALSGFTWLAPAIESAKPDFDWTFIPFPGSDVAADNKYIFGKYDQGWTIASATTNKEASLAYLAEFSEPANYQAFVTAVGVIPTQPGAVLDTALGRTIAPSLANFRIGWERYWISPKGAGEFAFPYATFFKPFGEFETAQQAADAAQKDLQSGLDASK
jgi:raffinose/stachyose/melibiose transport system substrate-binding protein